MKTRLGNYLREDPAQNSTEAAPVRLSVSNCHHNNILCNGSCCAGGAKMTTNHPRIGARCLKAYE
jgi:hypothetical protein